MIRSLPFTNYVVSNDVNEKVRAAFSAGKVRVRGHQSGPLAGADR
jgi:hypothetical protein